MIIYIYIGVIPAGHTQSAISLEGVEEEEREKHGKVEVKRKWWVLAQPPYSSHGSGRQSPG